MKPETPVVFNKLENKPSKAFTGMNVCYHNTLLAAVSKCVDIGAQLSAQDHSNVMYHRLMFMTYVYEAS